jgi:hypothetical protein
MLGAADTPEVCPHAAKSVPGGHLHGGDEGAARARKTTKPLLSRGEDGATSA